MLNRFPAPPRSLTFLSSASRSKGFYTSTHGSLVQPRKSLCSSRHNTLGLNLSVKRYSTVVPPPLPKWNLYGEAPKRKEGIIPKLLYKPDGTSRSKWKGLLIATSVLVTIGLLNESFLLVEEYEAANFNLTFLLYAQRADEAFMRMYLPQSDTPPTTDRLHLSALHDSPESSTSSSPSTSSSRANEEEEAEEAADDNAARKLLALPLPHLLTYFYTLCTCIPGAPPTTLSEFFTAVDGALADASPALRDEIRDVLASFAAHVHAEIAGMGTRNHHHHHHHQQDEEANLGRLAKAMWGHGHDAHEHDTTSHSHPSEHEHEHPPSSDESLALHTAERVLHLLRIAITLVGEKVGGSGSHYFDDDDEHDEHGHGHWAGDAVAARIEGRTGAGSTGKGRRDDSEWESIG